MKNILVLDYLLKQMGNISIVAPDIRKKLLKQFQIFGTDEIRENFLHYLKSRNGKIMKNAQNIWKFRLSDGDRVLYTYGRYLKYIPQTHKQDIVLLAYAKHDEQGVLAKNHHFEEEREWHEIFQILKVFQSLGADVDICNDQDFSTAIELVFEQTHQVSILTPDQEVSIPIEKIDKEVLLSEEQNRCVETFIRSPHPTLILGGAGTGKTLISVRILADYSSKNQFNAAYFTQSQALLENVENRYKTVTKSEDLPDMFFDINDFCLKKLGQSGQKSKLVNFNRYNTNFFTKLPPKLRHQCDKRKIDALSSWTEIRGIIKGQLDSAWHRAYSIEQEKLTQGKALKTLIDKGYLKRSQVNPRSILPGLELNEIEKNSMADRTLSLDEIALLKQALKFFSSVDVDRSDMGYEHYLQLSPQESTFDLENRKTMWSVYEEYKQFLEINKFLDDNDLALKVLHLLNTQPQPADQFGLIIVDEVQDYTELQIYLLKKLCKNENNIIFAGDANQNVNPTLFREEKLKALFGQDTRSDSTLCTFYLKGNFRCPIEAVKIANELSNYRRKLVASGKIEREQPEEAKRNGTQPIRLHYSVENLRLLLKEMKHYPEVALLVPDEDSKNQIIQLIQSQQTSDKNEHFFVHTVAEIKGMQYPFVVCYNLWGRHIDTWKAMFSETHSKGKTGLRYYFNLPYVAITRTQKHLCFIDKVTVNQLQNSIGLQKLDKFDSYQLHLNTLQTNRENWLKQAKAYEDNGNLQDAIQCYREAEASFKLIARCQAKQHAEQGEYQIAVMKAMVACEGQLVKEYSDQLGETHELKKLIKRISNLTNYASQKPYRCVDIIEKYFCTDLFRQEQINEAKLFCVSKLQDLISRYLDQIESNSARLEVV